MCWFRSVPRNVRRGSHRRDRKRLSQLSDGRGRVTGLGPQFSQILVPVFEKSAPMRSPQSASGDATAARRVTKSQVTNGELRTLGFAKGIGTNDEPS